MPKRHSRGVANQLMRPLSFREIRHALFMISFAFIPTLVVFLIFEGYVSKAVVLAMCRSDRYAIAGHDLAPLFNYYTSWVVHFLTAVAVSIGAELGAFRNTSQIKEKRVKRFRIVLFLTVIFVVVVGDEIHSNLALLSHERLFSVLSQVPALSPQFRYEPPLLLILPALGIGAALWAMCTIILCASKFLVEFERAARRKKVTDRIAGFSKALEALRSHFLALTVVLVTSTFGTVAWVRIPLGFLSAGPRDDFQAVGRATALVWGVTFSLTLIALCIYPFYWLRKEFAAQQKDADETDNDTLREWCRENMALVQVTSNLQLVLSMMSPAAVAVLSNLVSS